MYRTAGSDRKNYTSSITKHLLSDRKDAAKFSCHNLLDFRQIMKTIDVTGNSFDWLKYSVNLSDNSRSYRKAWPTSGAGTVDRDYH